ncbi:hypothetical protein [Pantoea agglomerans]|uniref:hypothetical protein n=1 Tax=Enterobacter agglomerans TaxID=549 RepID=UPI00320B7CCD
MLENYFGTMGVEKVKNQRLLAVQAALEIIKASAGASGANSRTDKVEEDADYAAKRVGPLADAIQAALNSDK